jgi:hypothetical protein
MPQETKAKFETTGTATASLQGWSTDLADVATTMDVLEKAFDYRGDVTITRVSGETITGYIFDRRRGADLKNSSVRLMTATSDDKVTIPFADVKRVEFGKDAAQGKSFETWVKKYVEKKLAGEKASIEAEALD